MSGQHFTLTISQSTADSGDFAIHMEEDGTNEHLLLQMKFTEQPMFDEKYLDGVMATLAKTLAMRVIEWRIAPDFHPETMPEAYSEAEAVVNEALSRIRKESYDQPES